MENRFNFKTIEGENDNLYTAIKFNKYVYVVIWSDTIEMDGYMSVIYSSEDVNKYLSDGSWVVQGQERGLRAKLGLIEDCLERR